MASVVEEAEFERMTATAVGLVDIIEDVADFSGQDSYIQFIPKEIIRRGYKFEIIDFQGNRIDTKFSTKPAKDKASDLSLIHI